MTPSFPDSGPLVIMTARPTCTNVLKAIVGYEVQILDGCKNPLSSHQQPTLQMRNPRHLADVTLRMRGRDLGGQG